MKAIFKKHWRWFVFLALPWVFLMFIFTYRIDYRIATPGNLTNVSNYIELEDEYPQENPIYSIYVMSFRRPTFMQFIVASLNDYHEVSQLPETIVDEGVSDRDLFESGQVDRNTSIDASFITSLEALGMDIEYEIEYIVRLIYHYIDIEADGQLNIGDIILSVNHNEDVLSAVFTASCGDYHDFEVERENGDVETLRIKKQDRGNGCFFGLNLREYYRITHADVNLKRYDSLVGGPSGGLMQTLYIYNALSEEDLTKGIIIAGTGGISIDGKATSVGAIHEKVITAHLRGVDIFFVPRNDQISNDNYSQALESAEKIGADMQIIGVETFEDVLNALLRHQAGERE